MPSFPLLNLLYLTILSFTPLYFILLYFTLLYFTSLFFTCCAGDLGIFCAPLNPPASKPYPPVSKSKRLVNVVSATAGDHEKGTGLGMASGVLCLVRALLLHELDRITAWGEGNLTLGVPEQHRYVTSHHVASHHSSSQHSTQHKTAQKCVPSNYLPLHFTALLLPPYQPHFPNTFVYTLPYPTLPYPTLPYPTLPYPTLPYPTLP